MKPSGLFSYANPPYYLPRPEPAMSQWPEDVLIWLRSFWSMKSREFRNPLRRKYLLAIELAQSELCARVLSK